MATFPAQTVSSLSHPSRLLLLLRFHSPINSVGVIERRNPQNLTLLSRAVLTPTRPFGTGDLQVKPDCLDRTSNHIFPFLCEDAGKKVRQRKDSSSNPKAVLSLGPTKLQRFFIRGRKFLPVFITLYLPCNSEHHCVKCCTYTENR